MRACLFPFILLFAAIVQATPTTEGSNTERNLFRIEHATSEILHQVTQAGLDVATVRGLGSAINWQPRGMAEIDLWLAPAERQALEARGIFPQPLRDEAREMWQRLQDQPERDRDYNNHAQLTSVLQAFALEYPEICRMYSIGQTVQGRDLWVMKVTDNPDVDEDEPEFKYISTMHGNEPVGTEMLLFLLGDLLAGYGTDPRLTALVNDMEIHILPMMNPDGNNAGTRTNAHGVDLNRNFPDPWSSPNNTGVGREPETAAVMAWTQTKDFDLSANFHTGALLVNYPFDNNATGSSVYTASPDDDFFIQVSEAYSIHNLPMWNGAFPHGITNGADWYAVSGGMQDWNYRYEGGMEVTVELSNTSWPNESQLPTLWNNNRESLLSYMEWALRGVRGVVTSAVTGLPLVGVEVRVTGRDFATWSAAVVGDYHRLLPAGTFNLTFTKTGYLPVTLSNVVVGTGAAAVRNVSLLPLVAAPDLALAAISLIEDDNGYLDPGDNSVLQVQVRNVGTMPATDLVGLLTDSSPWLVITSAAQSYGTLLPDAVGEAWFDVSVDPAAPEGSTVDFNLQATCTELTESLPFSMSIGLITEDFESGGFLAWPWTMGGNQPWTITGTAPYQGLRSARSGVIAHNQTSRMSLTLNVASAGEVEFAARVSSEANYDFLRFSVDGNVLGSWSGNQAWASYSFPVSAGVHVLSWSYEKDGSVSFGEDAAFVDWILLPPVAATPYPDWVVSPAALTAILAPGQATQQQILIQNTGQAALEWTATLSLDGAVQGFADLKLPKGVEDHRSATVDRNAGGPDAYGYRWADSCEPSGGPTFSWAEISTVGTALADADDQSYGPFNLGFSMPFYGVFHSSVRISSNGFLSFTGSESAYNNAGIPSAAAPNNVIAPFWDDLNPVTGGTIYWWDDPAADRFIVEWSAVRHYTGTATETFQVILSGDGSILCQYLIVTATSNCTVGIENASGTDGLQCVFNAGGFLVNNLAIRFQAEPVTPPWAVLSPLSGSVPPGGGVTLDLALSAADLVDGIYSGQIDLTSNDPDTPSLSLPLTLTVSSFIEPVDNLAINTASGQVLLTWSAVPGATGYTVYRSTVPYSNFAQVGTTATPGWIGSVTADGKWLYYVTATR